MPLRFDDFLPFYGGKVVAIGPLHIGDDIKEVCAWVFQPSTPDRANDAAATEMTTSQAGEDRFKQDTGTRRWRLLLTQLVDKSGGASPPPPPPPFKEGRAFAVAVALIATSDGKRVTWWGQPVDLIENAAAVLAAEDPDTAVAPALPDPEPPPTNS